MRIITERARMEPCTGILDALHVTVGIRTSLSTGNAIRRILSSEHAQLQPQNRMISPCVQVLVLFLQAAGAVILGQSTCCLCLRIRTNAMFLCRVLQVAGIHPCVGSTVLRIGIAFAPSATVCCRMQPRPDLATRTLPRATVSSAWYAARVCSSVPVNERHRWFHMPRCVFPQCEYIG